MGQAEVEDPHAGVEVLSSQVEDEHVVGAAQGGFNLQQLFRGKVSNLGTLVIMLCLQQENTDLIGNDVNEELLLTLT